MKFYETFLKMKKKFNYRKRIFFKQKTKQNLITCFFDQNL